MNRRDVFQAAPFGLMMAAAYTQGAAAAESANSEIVHLLREWNKLGKEADSADDEDRRDALILRRSEIEAQMLALPAMDLVDIVAKFVAFSRIEGEGDGPDLMMIEARNAVGVH